MFNANNIFNLLETTKSTGNDALLVYYTDHSANCSFPLPDGTSLSVHTMKSNLKKFLKKGKFKYILIIIDSCGSHKLANSLKSKKWAVIASTNPVNYTKGIDPNNGYSTYRDSAHSNITYATKFTRRMISILLRMTKAGVFLKL
jgi:glycosylphosphatidylinositol transamidase (GPIT) subunit GPI8